MKTQAETPYYIRTDEGETFYVESLGEALEQFTGEHGYRLSLEADGIRLIIRRGPVVDATLEVIRR